MPRPLLFIAAATLALLIGGCPGDQIDPGEWNAMSPQARLLYVKALLGEEQTRRAKGGNDRQFPQTPEAYVARIESAYAKGDRRPADQIFAEFGAPR